MGQPFTISQLKISDAIKPYLTISTFWTETSQQLEYVSISANTNELERWSVIAQFACVSYYAC